MRPNAADSCHIPQKQVHIIQRQLTLLVPLPNHLGQSSLREFQQHDGMQLRIGDGLLEVVAVDDLGGHADLHLLVNVGHQQVELTQVPLIQTAAEAVDGLLLLELPRDGLDLSEEVDGLVETSLSAEVVEETPERGVPTADHN
jgi:hypothetical protein